MEATIVISLSNFSWSQAFKCYAIIKKSMRLNELFIPYAMPYSYHSKA